MPSRLALAILATALSISPATAQIRATGAGTAGLGISAGSSGSGPSGMGRGVVAGSARFRQGHLSERRSTLLAYPYFYSDSDYDSREGSQPPQVVVVQASAPVPPPVPPAPRESLLIEWQGDHFVRSTTSTKDSTGLQVVPDYSEKSAAPWSATGRSAPGQKNAVQQVRELPPAVLVFHDGRKEEVSEYTIMSGTIYSKADYWTTGSWTRKIPIADLDVPATLKVNQERGLKFVLPTNPNEIVTRP
jgi:hypothetical protein